MLTPYKRGRQAEYAACCLLRKRGFHAQRSAGSHGPFDIVAWNEHGVWLIQVKIVKEEQFATAACRVAWRAWQKFSFPLYEGIHREIWIRIGNYWYIRDLDIIFTGQTGGNDD